MIDESWVGLNEAGGYEDRQKQDNLPNTRCAMRIMKWNIYIEHVKKYELVKRETKKKH